MFSRIATNRRPKRFSIRRASSFSCHSRSTWRLARRKARACRAAACGLGRLALAPSVRDASTRSCSVTSCVVSLPVDWLLAARESGPARGGKSRPENLRRLAGFARSRGHSRQDSRKLRQVVADQLEPVNRAAKAHVFEEGHRFARLIECEPNDTLAGGNAIAKCKRCHPFSGGPGQLRAAPVQCVDPILALERESCVERILAARQVGRHGLCPQARELKSMSPEGLGCGSRDRPGELAARSAAKARSPAAVRSFLAAAGRSPRSGALPQPAVRRSNGRARRQATPSPDQAFHDRPGR